MILVVTGGRDYDDREHVRQMLSWIHRRNPITALYHGATPTGRGADWMADEWATEHNVPVRRFPANWSAHGRKAGPMRNTQMLLHAKQEGEGDLVACVAFTGGRGTADCVRQAKGMRVVTYETDALTIP